MKERIRISKHNCLTSGNKQSVHKDFYHSFGSKTNPLRFKVLSAALSISMLLLMSPLPMQAAEPVASADGKSVTVVRTPEQMQTELSKSAEMETQDVFEQVSINTKKDTVTKDGVSSNLQEALDISKNTEKKLTDGNDAEDASALTAYLKKRDVYQVSKNGSTIKVEAPYQMQRLIVCTAQPVRDTYGASDVVYDTQNSCYILTYATEEETKTACGKLQKEFGSSSVFPDEAVVLKSQDNAAVQTQTATSSEENSYTAWSVHMSGLDSLKTEAEADDSLGKVKVAVIDTGVNRNHVMLKGRIASSSRKMTSYLSSLDVSDPDYDYEDVDYSGHGTHVAGILADGTSSQVKLIIIRAFVRTSEGTTVASALDLLNAMQYAVKKGAKVINLSADISSSISKDLYQMYERSLKKLRNKGAVICVAAGNQMNGESKNMAVNKSYPARSKYVLAIGSLKKNKKKSSFSYYGRALDFVAGGDNVRSASNADSSSYRIMSGTSQATPVISAAAAMIRLYHPSYSRSQVVRVLRQHSSRGKNGTKVLLKGYGLVYMNDSSDTALKKKQHISAPSSIRTAINDRTSRIKASDTAGTTIRFSTSGKKILKVTGKGKIIPKAIGKKTVSLFAPCSSKYDYQVKQITVTIIPKMTKITKLSQKSKSLHVVWKKETPSTGYQVKYASNKKFAHARTIRVSGSNAVKTDLSSLKSGRTWYVKVRVYKILSGRYFYSRWSSVKTAVIR